LSSVALLAAAAVAVPASAAAATAGPAEAACRGCVVLDHLVQNVVSSVYTPKNPPGMSVGDVVVFTEQIFDAAGEQVGSDSGRIVVIRQTADGHFWVLDRLTIKLDGSTLFAFGVVDNTAELAGAWSTIRAVAVSGPLARRSGTLSWQINPSNIESASSRYVLCR
jgi:hypothetical protein